MSSTYTFMVYEQADWSWPLCTYSSAVAIVLMSISILRAQFSTSPISCLNENMKKLVFTTLLMYKYNPLSALFNSQNVFFGFFFKRGKVCWAQIKSLIKMCLYKQFLGDVTNNSKANHDPVCILHKCDVLTWNCQCTTESADLWKMHKQFCLYVLLTLFNTRLQ